MWHFLLQLLLTTRIQHSLLHILVRFYFPFFTDCPDGSTPETGNFFAIIQKMGEKRHQECLFFLFSNMISAYDVTLLGIIIHFFLEQMHVFFLNYTADHITEIWKRLQL